MADEKEKEKKRPMVYVNDERSGSIRAYPKEPTFFEGVWESVTTPKGTQTDLDIARGGPQKRQRK